MKVPRKNQVNFNPVDINLAIETTQATKMIRIAQDIGCNDAHIRTVAKLYPDGQAGATEKMNRLWKIAKDRGWVEFKNGKLFLTESGESI